MKDLEMDLKLNQYVKGDKLTDNLKSFTNNYSFNFKEVGFRNWISRNLLNSKKSPKIIAWKPANYDVAICPSEDFKIKSVESRSDGLFSLVKLDFEKNFSIYKNGKITYKVYSDFNKISKD